MPKQTCRLLWWSFQLGIQNKTRVCETSVQTMSVKCPKKSGIFFERSKNDNCVPICPVCNRKTEHDRVQSLETFSRWGEKKNNRHSIFEVILNYLSFSNSLRRLRDRDSSNRRSSADSPFVLIRHLPLFSTRRYLPSRRLRVNLTCTRAS